MVADISKAFVQIQLCEEDRKLLVFRWPVKEPDGSYLHKFYRFEQMPWGISCSLFVLNAALRKLFCEHAEIYPKDKPLMKEFEDHAYLDDVAITGEEDRKTVGKPHKLKNVVADAFFQVTKFKSYPTRLTKEFGLEEKNKPFKILGLGFDPVDDCFFVKARNLQEYRHKKLITKKEAASILARPFDPLGFATPALLKEKLLQQKIDVNHPKADWKHHLTQEETDKWHLLTDELSELHLMKIWRLMRAKNKVRREYHIFTDTSGLAIGAAIYCVSYPKTGTPKVTLIAAKSKIIPRVKPSESSKTNFPETNRVSINKLELIGALLGLQLFETIRPSLESMEKVHCWTDSSVGLTWIRNKKQTGVRYIDTRLEKIRKLSNPEDWNHCPGKENPADMSTRVCLTKELINNQVWIEVPEWLRNPTVPWPNLREAKINIRTQRARCEACLKFPNEQKC
jgi:hypothetical protein